jgi:hypothetical protein
MFSQKVGNKLRTYKLLKEVFETEMYLSKNIAAYITINLFNLCFLTFIYIFF